MNATYEDLNNRCNSVSEALRSLTPVKQETALRRERYRLALEYLLEAKKAIRTKNPNAAQLIDRALAAEASAVQGGDL